MNSRASADSSALFLMKEWRGLKRFSCRFTVLFCMKSLSFLIILLTNDFTGSRKFWQVTATFWRLLLSTSRITLSKLPSKLLSTRPAYSSLPFAFSIIFPATAEPTFWRCSTSRLKVAGRKSSLVTRSRQRLTILKASLRKSERVPGRMQACLKMMSTHLRTSLSSLERSRMFFSRTITHIFKFHPWLSRNWTCSHSCTLAPSSAKRQLVYASGKIGIAQVYRNFSSSFRKKEKSKDVSRSLGQFSGNWVRAVKILKKTVSRICWSLPERSPVLLESSNFSPACISFSIVFFSSTLQYSSFLLRFMYHALIWLRTSDMAVLSPSSFASWIKLWYLESCSLKQNYSYSLMFVMIYRICSVSGTYSFTIWCPYSDSRYFSLNVNREIRYFCVRLRLPTSLPVMLSN